MSLDGGEASGFSEGGGTDTSHVGSSENKVSADTKFKCHICFELPVEPVVTVCGHMYCWRCLHAWLERGTAQCPVCKAGVTSSSVIPVYGGGAERAPPHSTPSSDSGRGPGQEGGNGGCGGEGATREIPERPRAERPPPPHNSAQFPQFHGESSRTWRTHNIQFGFFPFGMGIQFGSARGGSGVFSGLNAPGGHATTRPLTPEQQRSQFISTLLIMLGFTIVFWAIFVDNMGH